MDCLLNLLLITLFHIFSAVYANDIHNVTSGIDVDERSKTINWSLSRIDSPNAVGFDLSLHREVKRNYTRILGPDVFASDGNHKMQVEFF